MLLDVRTFDTHGMCDDKGQITKVLEEAAEAYAEWQYVDRCMGRGRLCRDCDRDGGRGCWTKMRLADELADVVMATCNTAERLGLDMAAAMERCARRQEDRGRYADERVRP